MTRTPSATTSINAESLPAELLRLRVYAIARESQGLSAFPCSPKDHDKIGVGQIGRETGIVRNHIFRLREEIDILQANSKVAPRTPEEQRFDEALQRVYADHPVPVTDRGSIAYEEVSRATGVPLEYFKKSHRREPLVALREHNGEYLYTPLTIAEARRLLEVFAADLRSKDEPLPWFSKRSSPNFSEIARRSGVDREAIKRPPLRDSFDTIFAGLEPVVQESKSDERSRFARYVDSQIAARCKLPTTAKGIAFKAIGKSASVAAHRLRMAHLLPEIERWEAWSAAATT